MRRVAFLVLLFSTLAIAYDTHCLVERCSAENDISDVGFSSTNQADPHCQGELVCIARASFSPMATVAVVPPVAAADLVAPSVQPSPLRITLSPEPLAARTSLQALYQTFLI